MKNKNFISSLSFALLILIAILVQSVHSFDHFSELRTQKKCNHNHNKNVAEINDLHLQSHHCFTCEFTFSNVLKSEIFSFYFYKNLPSVHYTFSYSREITQTFRGSLFALRAPPKFIV